MMGSGKTSVGRKTSKILNVPFVDADHEIEKAAGCTITDIFTMYGEDEFRDGEERVMERLLNDDTPKILASGGGAFMSEATRALSKEKAVSLWLRTEHEVLVKRTTGRSHRPQLNYDDPSADLKVLIAERYPIYAEADIIIDTYDEHPHETANRVATAICEHFDVEFNVAHNNNEKNPMQKCQ
ncbi:MAG: shikimate kinase [Alphaproteobacteria bacterium]|nr:shikimate kinase [Alphaproteobacteria bacterium]